jgi:site-specific DNA-cytosine methylase
MSPYAVDLCCGIGGWADGLLAAGFHRVIGFDVRRFKQGYPGDLVLQDIRTLDGRQFRDVALIVASPPCQEFSRKGLPWHRDKPDPDLGIVLFKACWRIIQEAGCPGIIENVRMAQRWMGRAAMHFGPFYLWGDVPLLKPQGMKFVKGVFGGNRRNHTSRDWGKHLTHRSPVLTAKIPFDLAYWIGAECLAGRMPCGDAVVGTRLISSLPSI